jgi:hypothetical protein
MRATASLIWLMFVVLAVPCPTGAAPADRPAAITEEAARSGCPPREPLEPGSQCTVEAFGVVGTGDGGQLVYGLYTDQSATGDYTLRTAVIVYQRQPDGRLLPLISAGDRGDIYSTPKLLTGETRTLLHLPGYEDGTGNFNVERLYVWREGAWKQIDLDTWRKDLSKRLPQGYEIWKGVFPDYVKMVATTPLWRWKSDGNCCPTGGRADIVLDWQGDRLVLKSVTFKLGAKYAK